MPRTSDYQRMLEIAIAEARAGLAEGGIPIGAALFDGNGQLLGRGHNRRIQENDPSIHGETDAFRKAGRQASYRDSIMVTTLAPCWYCSGLVRQFRIGTVVVGESHNFRGGIDWLRENGVTVVDLASSECITLLGDFGAVVRGDITDGSDRYVVEPGPRGGFGIAWRAFDEGAWSPYVLLSASLSVLSSLTERNTVRTRLTALDFRSSIAIGKLFASEGFGGRIGPYVVARNVTGALYWKLDGRVKSVQPDDLFQIGLGLSANAGDLDAFAEVSPFGERSAVVGLGYAF